MASQNVTQKVSINKNSRPTFKKSFKFELFSLHTKTMAVLCSGELEVLGVKARASFCACVELCMGFSYYDALLILWDRASMRFKTALASAKSYCLAEERPALDRKHKSFGSGVGRGSFVSAIAVNQPPFEFY